MLRAGAKTVILGAANPIRRAFASGAAGFYIDLSNQSSLYQDAAASTPVTAAGQPIGRALDLSGNNTLITQSGSARPAWQADGSALFDGVNDYLATTFNPTNAISLGFHGSFVNLTTSFVCPMGSTDGTHKAVLAALIQTGVPKAGVIFGTKTLLATTAAAGTYLSVIVTTDGITDTLYINGVNVLSMAAGGTTLSNLPIYIGAQNGGTPQAFANAACKRGLVIGRALTPTEIANISTYWSTH